MPNPSTTSATTARLTDELRDAFVERLCLGGSPAAVARLLGVTLADVEAQMAVDDVFRERIDGVVDVLSRNVASALYKQAMEGNVTAQTNWLKLRPPPEWRRADARNLEPATIDEVEPRLDDEHVRQLVRALAVRLPQGVEAALAEEGGGDVTGDVPASDPARAG